MSDLPIREQYGDDEDHSECLHWCSPTKDVVTAWLNGDLLTRVEAANDPEVRRIVLREWKNKTRWEGDDRISMEVGFGAVLVTDDE